MKTQINARKMALTLALLAAGASLAPTTASAQLFGRRTVVIEAPTAYVPTVYAAPVTTVYSAPSPVTYAAPVVDSAVVPTTYLPTVSTVVPTVSTVVPTTYLPTTYVPTTYVPTVSTVAPAVVEVRRGLLGRTRVRYYGY